MKKYLLLLLLPAMSVPALAQKDSSCVFFANGSSVLSMEARTVINELLYDEQLQSASIRILGYADEPGGDTFNQKLSGERAMNVKQFLLRSGVREDHIVLCEGRGSNVGGGVDASRRRVDLLVNKVAKKATGFAALGVNETMELKEISFSVGTAIMIGNSYGALKELAEELKALPSMKISLEGHVCCHVADDTAFGMILRADQQQLSEKRAKVVYDYLLSVGIAANRLSYKGFGVSRPKVYPAVTLEQKQANRRVEVRVLQK